MIPLNKYEKITNNSSPIPPCNCPIGTNINVSKEFTKYWDKNYHIKLFEKALYKTSMTKEILNNYTKLIEIKEDMISKIKLNY